jgi:hypothetical protein
MEHYFQNDKEGAIRRRMAQGREWINIRNVYHASHVLRAPLASSNRYPYRPLDLSRNEIRLLRKSDSPKVDGQVSYTLSHVSLDEKPQYEALSYTWCDEKGDAGLNMSIIVDGHAILVTKNLEAALGQLFTDEDEKTLWVDALCINQADVLERNEQVSKMKIVYQEATGVVAWLGAEYNESRNAFKLLRSFLTNGIKETVYDGTEPADPHEAAPESVVKDTHAVINLFNRQYWQRSWVVQEVTLAKRVIFHCGSDSISWEDMDRILKELAKEGVFISDAFFSTVVGHLLWHLLSSGPSQVVRKDNADEEELTTLHQALVRHRLKRATDPRDKIYSLLGIIPSNIQARVPVDYSLETLIVFQNVATFIVIEEKDLSILAENKNPSDHKVLPSWVPNWANANIADKIRIDRNNYPHNSFNASGAVTTAEAYLLPNHLLRVKGIRLGTITAAGTALPDFVDEEFNFTPVLDTLYEWWLLFYFTGRRDIIGRRSFVDIVNYGHFYSHLAPENIKEIEEMTLANIKIAFLIYKPWDRTLLPTLGTLEKPVTEPEKRKAEVNIWNIAPNCRKRKFIVVDGKECGIGPQGVEVGDHIVVVLGCRVPVILRERKGEEYGGYRNVGDAFLQGYMEGKALKDIENGTREFESFELH